MLIIPSAPEGEVPAVPVAATPPFSDPALAAPAGSVGISAAVVVATWGANLGSVMSGLVEDGVIVAKLPWLRIGAIALPDPLFCGPTLATTLGLETSLRALVAACAEF